MPLAALGSAMHPDVPEEQAYFDRALDLRAIASRPTSTAPRHARRRPQDRGRAGPAGGTLGVVDPAQSVAFGRIDAHGNSWYIGKGAIWDEENDLVVVNLVLDNHVYRNCQMDRCRFYYSGGPFELIDTHITNSELVLNQPAKNIYAAIQIFRTKSPGSTVVSE